MRRTTKKKDIKVIYVVTCMKLGYKYWDNKRGPDGYYMSYQIRTSKDQTRKFGKIRKRTWCWFSELKDAKEAVEQNALDMYEEGYYPVALIEEYQEGFPYGGDYKARWWYKWNKKAKGYKRSKEPKIFSNTAYFAIG